jgi:hypothetical protein
MEELFFEAMAGKGGYIKEDPNTAAIVVASVQEGITLLQNATDTIGNFDKTISKLASFAMYVLDSNDDYTKLKRLEALVNDILSNVKTVNDDTKTFTEWAKSGWQETISDKHLNLILTDISMIRTYIDNTNIALEIAIKSWESMKNNEKYKRLLKQLYGIQSKHSTLKQKGVGAIEQYKNAVHELIEAIKIRWPFNEIPSILNHLLKVVNNLGNPQTTDFTKQLRRALDAKPK